MGKSFLLTVTLQQHHYINLDPCVSVCQSYLHLPTSLLRGFIYSCILQHVCTKDIFKKRMTSTCQIISLHLNIIGEPKLMYCNMLTHLRNMIIFKGIILLYTIIHYIILYYLQCRSYTMVFQYHHMNSYESGNTNWPTRMFFCSIIADIFVSIGTGGNI